MRDCLIYPGFGFEFFSICLKIGFLFALFDFNWHEWLIECDAWWLCGFFSVAWQGWGLCYSSRFAVSHSKFYTEIVDEYWLFCLIWGAYRSGVSRFVELPNPRHCYATVDRLCSCLNVLDSCSCYDLVEFYQTIELIVRVFTCFKHGQNLRYRRLYLAKTVTFKW